MIVQCCTMLVTLVFVLLVNKSIFSAARLIHKTDITDIKNKVDEPEGAMHINGVMVSQNSSWPQPQQENEIIMMIPQKMSTGDQITIVGTMKNNKDSLTISLLNGFANPDYGTIPYRLEFDIKNDEFKIFINGTLQDIPLPITITQLISDEEFRVTLSLDSNTQSFITNINESEVHGMRLDINPNMFDHTRFLQFVGNIRKVSLLAFSYGSG